MNESKSSNLSKTELLDFLKKDQIIRKKKGKYMEERGEKERTRIIGDHTESKKRKILTLRRARTERKKKAQRKINDHH